MVVGVIEELEKGEEEEEKEKEEEESEVMTVDWR